MARPSQALPYGPKYKSEDEYISSLLAFVTGSELHQALCGGVHIIDFYTRSPDLYASLVPEDWRLWFANVPIDDILDLLLREDIEAVRASHSGWRSHAFPPASLLEFIQQVRDLSLDRTFVEPQDDPLANLDRPFLVGMKAKKKHEVTHFASFVSGLADNCNSKHESRDEHPISHLVDFGSGQGYLGRVLASSKYQKNVVALESRSLNIEGARKMDVHAKLAKKPIVWRNKKTWMTKGVDTAQQERMAALKAAGAGSIEVQTLPDTVVADIPKLQREYSEEVPDQVASRIMYIEHVIDNGDLSDVASQLQAVKQDDHPNAQISSPQLLVMSLHSCGNLVHHGLRSLLLNSAVKTVAMIGCCYNLCTDKLGPPTYKLPFLHLRSGTQRYPDRTLTSDPHGFPMSDRFTKYQHAKDTGVRFNITARMMAVQAPANWTKEESDSFFTRHFYRALIQRIFLDTGFVNPPINADQINGSTVHGGAGGTEPIVIGNLAKPCYKSFVTYVRGVARKLGVLDPDQGRLLAECLKDLTDEDIEDYEKKYRHRKRDICVVWSLMSFAAQLVECAFIADRWQFLTEQKEVKDAWVQTVFDYRQSPRNLVIVGIKK